MRRGKIKEGNLLAGISLTANVSEQEVKKMWEWACEFPKANFDDYSPKDFNGYKSLVLKKLLNGTILLGVRNSNHKLIGYLMLKKINETVWELDAMGFSKAVHRTGMPQTGFKLLLNLLKKRGCKKVIGIIFNDNVNVRRFYDGFGFVQEGLLSKQTKRNGENVDMAILSLFME